MKDSPRYFQYRINITKKDISQDQNLIKPSGDEDPSSITVYVSYGENIELKIEKSSSIGELRRAFCKTKKLKSESVRFLIDGERLDDKETAETLGLNDRAVIEAFMEVDGGGLPLPNLYNNQAKILEALDDTFDEEENLDSDSDLSTDDSNETNSEFQESSGAEVITNCNEAIGHSNEVNEDIQEIIEAAKPEDETITNIKQCSNNETSQDIILGTERKTNGENDTYETQNKDQYDPEESIDLMNIETETEEESALCRQTEDLNILDKIRQEYKDGKLLKNNPLHMKIIYLLELPKLVNIEQKMLNSLWEMKEKHDEWEEDTDHLISSNKKQGRKRKQVLVATDVNRKLRKLAVKDNKIVSAMPTSEIKQSEEQTLHDVITNDSSALLSPKQRERLLSKFGMRTPSPLRRRTIPTEEELRRFSVAVHLWAERTSGSIKTLYNMRLTDKNFKEILQFAGPNSEWNLLKDRSILQYKSMWRNSVKTRHTYRGHPNTGFETEFKVHGPSSPYCPFGHCKSGIISQFDVDLTLLTPTKISSDESLNKCLNTNPSRRLFTPKKDSDKSEDIDDKILGQIESNVGKNVTDIDIGVTNRSQQSPSKLELKRQNRQLLQQIRIMRKNFDGNQHRIVKDLFIAPEITPTGKLIKCKIDTCDKEFGTVFGLTKHRNKVHSDKFFEKKTLQSCPVCGKNLVYIDQHMKFVHNNVIGPKVCQVCKKTIHGDMKKHRGSCSSCPFCDYKNSKKLRLLKHIESCPKRNEVQSKSLDATPKKKTCDEVQTVALDLTPKLKNVKEIQAEAMVITPKLKNVNEVQIVALDLSPKLKNVQEVQAEALVITRKLKDVNESTPKRKNFDVVQAVGKGAVVENSQQIMNEKHPTYDSITVQNKQSNIQMTCKIASQIVQQPISEFSMNEDKDNERSILKKRSMYPFDEQDSDEPYVSEFEEDDSEEFTTQRRLIKDKLELELRAVDDIKNIDLEGDDEIENQFRLFMQAKKRRLTKEGKFAKLKEVSTVEMYTKVIRNVILPAFHDMISPFDARWLLDCTTPKDCTVCGEKRSFVEKEEPIYFTSTILGEALKKIDTYMGESGSQRGIILAATMEFLDFIELHFNNKLNVYGPGPLKRIKPYHNGVRSFMKGTGAWKASNEERAKAVHSNKTRDEYENPNKELEILEKYHKYIKSSERLSSLTKVLSYSSEDSPLPSGGDMVELGRIVMGEIVASTGCRPVVVRHLTVGAYADMKPGFNPHRVSPGDCIIDEERENQKIFRRVNPNLPPKNMACKHQLEQKTAVCPVLCDDRCDPDGYNIYVDWDKTQATRGPSYLHLTRPLKSLVDAYDIVRTRYFKDRKSNLTSTTDWLNEDETPFFLNSACSSFQFLDLKHFSEAMGVDVTAYSFRRIVATWALSHESAEIRNAEEEALQHGVNVAKDRYLQNKQIKPQTLTQRYMEEECLFPKQILENLERAKEASKTKIKETEENRKKKRYENLVKGKEAYKKSISENKPLGPRHRVLAADRKQFKDIIEELHGDKLDITSVKAMKPPQWRKFILRLVCTVDDWKGEDLRSLWVKIYKGDLRWGVRDARFKAKINHWPRKDTNFYTQNQDRNSWIASCIRKSLLTDMKLTEKKNYLKQM